MLKKEKTIAKPAKARKAAPAAKRVPAKKASKSKNKALRQPRPHARRAPQTAHEPAETAANRAAQAPASPGQKTAIAAAEAAHDKKAVDVLVLDMQGLSPVMDYMVLAGARSETHLRAIAENIEEMLAKRGEKTLRREGYQEGRWVVLDYGDLMVNVFLDRQRSFYALEKLWGRAKVIARYEF
jgi:ribosome-associated protein